MRVCKGRRQPATIGVLLVILAAGAASRARHVSAFAQDAGGDAALKAALMREGQDLYGQCSECHSEGGVGPTLAGDKGLANKDFVVKQILAGSSSGEMPKFAPDFTDRQVAAVATYVRNAWDNAYGLVLEDDAKRLRAALADKK